MATRLEELEERLAALEGEGGAMGHMEKKPTHHPKKQAMGHTEKKPTHHPKKRWPEL
jgi:hypothetical protein